MEQDKQTNIPTPTNNAMSQEEIKKVQDARREQFAAFKSKVQSIKVETKEVDKNTIVKTTTRVDFKGIKTITEETIDIKEHNAEIDKKVAALIATKL